jgi:hypothetical protein
MTGASQEVVMAGRSEEEEVELAAAARRLLRPDMRSKGTSRTSVSHAATRSSRGVMKRAASDLERGLKNTDCRSPDATSARECPTPSRAKRRRS